VEDEGDLEGDAELGDLAVVDEDLLVMRCV
jgi:hypothetical protein